MVKRSTKITNTNEVTVSKTKTEIINEAKRIEESTRLSSKSHYNSCLYWSVCHYVLGLPTTVLSTVVAVSSFNELDSSSYTRGVIAIVVAALSALTTFLNPQQKSAIHQKAGNEYDALSNRSRIFATIDCWGNDSDVFLTERLKELSEKQSKLNSSYPQPLPFAYYAANRGIKKGEAEFAVDRKQTLP